MLDASINKAQPTTFVNIGLQNGVLLRTVLDPINGQLTDTRTRLVRIFQGSVRLNYLADSWVLGRFDWFGFRYNAILLYWPYPLARG